MPVSKHKRKGRAGKMQQRRIEYAALQGPASLRRATGGAGGTEGGRSRFLEDAVEFSLQEKGRIGDRIAVFGLRRRVRRMRRVFRDKAWQTEF